MAALESTIGKRLIARGLTASSGARSRTCERHPSTNCSRGHGLDERHAREFDSDVLAGPWQLTWHVLYRPASKGPELAQNNGKHVPHTGTLAPHSTLSLGSVLALSVRPERTSSLPAVRARVSVRCATRTCHIHQVLVESGQARQPRARRLPRRRSHPVRTESAVIRSSA
jgi:hypothetical protein